MGLPSSDAVWINAEPRAAIDALTRLSVDASWWPGARATGAYGWVRVEAPATSVERSWLRADISEVREWDGFGWTITDGPIVGRAEWWMEPFKDGVIVHYLLDAERGRASWWRTTAALADRHRRAIRRGLNALKDHLEQGSGSVR